MNNQAPLLFRRGAFTLSEADRRQPACHIRPGTAMTPPVRGFRIETHAFHAESAARAFFKTRKDLNFDGILLNVTFEDNWKELYDGAKVEYGADGVMRCLRLDYSSAMALHRIAVAEGKRRAFSVRGEKAVSKGKYGLGQRPAERHAGDSAAAGSPGGKIRGLRGSVNPPIPGKYPAFPVFSNNPRKRWTACEKKGIIN